MRNTSRAWGRYERTHPMKAQTSISMTSAKSLHAQSTIGSISGSQAWSASGEHDKAAAVDAMRKAADKRDPNQGYGKAEEWAGKLTGCEGMQKEGAASSQKRSD